MSYHKMTRKYFLSSIQNQKQFVLDIDLTKDKELFPGQ
jgi:hypothetical protein